MTFTATVSGSSQVAGFSVAYADLADVGTITSSGSNSVVYKAPAKPPIYPGVFPPSSQQGTIILQAAFSAGAFSPVGTSETITITAPSVTAGISPATIVVALGGTAQFTGYAVGNVNNTVTWQVAGVTGGSAANGTITATGLYTAPAAIPMTGPNVSVSAVSLADPTKLATAVVTLH